MRVKIMNHRILFAFLLSTLSLAGCSPSPGGSSSADAGPGDTTSASMDVESPRDGSDTTPAPDAPTPEDVGREDAGADSGPETRPFPRCVNVCQTADDCDSQGSDPSDWACNDGVCEATSGAVGTAVRATCSDDFDCSVELTPLEKRGCRSTSECPNDIFGHAAECVELDGSSYCAPLPGARGCRSIGATSKQADRPDGSGQIEVCLSRELTCLEEFGYCVEGCRPNSLNPTCSGESVCSQDFECICENDADCTNDGHGTCFDGMCGCGGESACDSLEANRGHSYACQK